MIRFSPSGCGESHVAAAVGRKNPFLRRRREARRRGVTAAEVGPQAHVLMRPRESVGDRV